MKRLFDIVASGCGLLVLSPIFLVVAIWIKLDSRGPVFYRQVRVGYKNRDFRIFKFRSMRVGADKGSLVTIGGRDPRVTRSGYFFNRNLKYGISRYVNIAILILVVTSICHNVFLYSIMNYQDLLEQGYYEKANLMNIIISICTWPFIYTAYFMIARAFSKIPNYSLYKISN